MGSRLTGKSMSVPSVRGCPRPTKLTVLIPLLVGLCYLSLFHAYGFQLEDEGTILYQIHRTAVGQVPYRDFATGYTPGFFWLNALMFRFFGESVGCLRMLLLVIHGMTALGLALISGWLLGPANSFWPVILWLVFLPLFPGEFCSFNVPYPAWYATAGFVWAALGLMRWREEKGLRWLVTGSLGAAFALACKPNSGAFAFVAIGIVILRANQAARDPFWWPVWFGTLGLVAAAFGFNIVSPDFPIYWLPVAVAMLCLAVGRLRGPHPEPVAKASIKPWGTVIVTALLTTLPWMLFLIAILGVGRFIREVTLLGSGADIIYYIPFPWPGRVSGLASLLLALLGVSGILLRGRRSVRVAAAAVVAAGLAGLGALLVIAGGALMPEGLIKSVGWQVERAAFPLSLAVQWTALAMLARRLARPLKSPLEEDISLSRIETGLLFSLCMFLQLYPRADFMHLVSAAPLTLVVGFVLLERSVAGWAGACRCLGWPRVARSLGFAVAVLISLVCLLRLGPNLQALPGGDKFTLLNGRAELNLPVDSASLLSELEEVSSTLSQLASEREAVFTFPALAAVNFLAAREAPTRHDYFFPGRPDHEDEARLVTNLLSHPPRAAVTLNREFRFFSGSPGYYLLLRHFFSQHYGLVKRVGRFDILMRSDLLSDRRPPGLSREGSEALSSPAGGGFDMDKAALIRLLVSTRSSTARRSAVAELLGSLRRFSRGSQFSQWVRDAMLSRAEEVLLLRVIRDYGDYRAAPYLLNALSREDLRIRAAALEAATWIGSRMTDESFAWGHLPGSVSRPALVDGGAVQRMEKLLASPQEAPPVRVFAAKVLGVVGSPATASLLRRVVAGDADRAVRVAAAEALLRLGKDPFDCSLVPLLGGLGRSVKEVLPGVVAQWYERHPREVRPCMVAAIKLAALDGAPPRVLERAREVLWIVAAASDRELIGLLERVAARQPALAFAASWSAAYLRRAGGRRMAGSRGW